FPGISRRAAASFRQRGRTRVREDPRLLRRAVDVRATHLRARARRRRAGRGGVHARLLPPGAGPLPRGHRDEAVARDPQEPEAAQAEAPLPRRADQALLRAGLHADRGAVRPRESRLTESSTPESSTPEPSAAECG